LSGYPLLIKIKKQINKSQSIGISPWWIVPRLEVQNAKEGTQAEKKAVSRQFIENSAGYVEMLEQASLMTERPRLCGDGWVYQQDNATVYNACPTKDFFQESNFALLDHPACSDLNPIENFWGWSTSHRMKMRHYKLILGLVCCRSR
uniref:Tc1-like transposase DDE domain-containing protein n=1 Tax=Echeneis naucrates TaxID=173247 RepID=A0A665ULQ1_ECHNA